MRNLQIFETIALVTLLCCLANSVVTGEESKSDDSSNELPPIFDYKNYLERFDKNYTPMEAVRKFKLFISRTMNIFKHNVLYKANSAKYFLKQNEFTDLTPEELEQYKGSKFSDTDFEPVEGADEYPNLPASRYRQMKEDNQELESQAGLVDESNDLGERLSKTLDETLGSGRIADPKAFLKVLKSNPDVAKKIASIVEPSGSASSIAEKEYEASLQAAAKRSGVKFSPIVKSDNKNYDKSQLNSYGFSSESSLENKNKENHDRKMTDSMYLDLDDPFLASGYDTDDLEDEGKSWISMTNLIDGAKSVFRILSEDNDYILEDDKPSDDEKKPKKRERAPIEKGLKYLIDWRTKGCIAPPRIQGKCNSCYAFASLAMMEFLHCIQKKKLTNFSTQYLVDCGEKSELKGCQGGRITAVGEFIKDFGLELDTIYPYSGKENECPPKKVNDKKSAAYLRPMIKRWVHLTKIGAWYKWITKSPLIVGINMPTDFLSYGGGIHSGMDCVMDMTHAMLLVGSGTEDGEHFWLLKNSYGDKWGEAGYFRLSHNAPLKCFNSAFVVRAQFK